MNSLASTCYFYIRKIGYNESVGREDDRYVGAVELGTLTEHQATSVFQAVVHRLVCILNMTPEKGWSVIANEPRFLQVSECNFEETGKKDITEYALQFEHETDPSVAIRWVTKSESFRRRHYKTAREQLDLDLDEAVRPENNTILAIAIRIAEWTRKKMRPDGRLVSAFPLENTCLSAPDLDSAGDDTSNADTDDGAYSTPPKSFWDDALRNFYDSASYALQKCCDAVSSIAQGQPNNLCTNDTSSTGVYSEASGFEEQESTSARTESVGDLKNTDTVNAAAFLKQMEELGPPMCGKKGDENWIHTSEVAGCLGTTTENLAKDRCTSKPKSENDDKKPTALMGVDKKGRAWRKRGAQTGTFYLRVSVDLPLLTGNSDPSKEES